MILELKNVSKSYKVKVLENINYKFEKGKFYCINGKSGSGKSTLIQMLGLLIQPTNGKILINNEDVNKLNDNSRAKIRNKEIGFVFQSYYLDPLLKSYENVMLPMYINGKNETITKMKERAIELLKLVDLEDRINYFPKELSGGEQQRVAIARALANDPNIILADEPTGSLDPENEKNIMKILKRLSRDGKCVIVVSHNPNTKKYADVILSINNHTLKEVKINEK
jgi:putative ABC transport system ATP-binding protein